MTRISNLLERLQRLGRGVSVHPSRAFTTRLGEVSYFQYLLRCIFFAIRRVGLDKQWHLRLSSCA